MLRSVIKTITAAVIAVAAAVFVAAPAGADPTDNPCELAVTFLCQFLPIAPNLEGDVDLTQQLPPADICASGCI